MIYGGLMFPIIHTHPLNNLIMDTQLNVYLGWYFLLDALLSYIFMLIYESLVSILDNPRPYVRTTYRPRTASRRKHGDALITLLPV